MPPQWFIEWMQPCTRKWTSELYADLLPGVTREQVEASTPPSWVSLKLRYDLPADMYKAVKAIRSIR